jgi:hypothetical protein
MEGSSMKSATVVIVLLLVATAFTSLAVADLGPTKERASIDPAPRHVIKATAGPYGPAALSVLYRSSAFDGTPGFSTAADLNGDGTEDLLFSTIVGNIYSFSAIDGATMGFLWTNRTFDFGGILFESMVMELYGTGKSDVVFRSVAGIHGLVGHNGSTWNESAAMGINGEAFADINGDGAIEYCVGLMDGNTVTAFNVSTGAKVWLSGNLGGMSFGVGQFDADVQSEIVYSRTNGVDKFNMTVYDPVKKSMEWMVNLTNSFQWAAGDADGNGKMDLLINEWMLNPVRVSMYKTPGTQVWINNSYTSPVFMNRVWDCDGDSHVEIISSDWSTQDIEVIDGATGFRQGYWTSAAYAPANTWSLPSDEAGNEYLVSMGGSVGDIADTVFYPSNLTIKHQYKFSPITYPLTVNDTDGDGGSNILFTDDTTILDYNFSSSKLLWSHGTLGTFTTPIIGWALGNTTPGGRKVMDLATLRCPATKVCKISFFEPSDGSITNSTVNYQGGALSFHDMNGDGQDEVIFSEVNYTIKTRTFMTILTAKAPPKVSMTIPTLQVNEDSTATHVVDLDGLFIDDRPLNSRTYAYVPPQGTAYVSGTVDQAHWLNITAALKDWNGNTTLNVSCTVGLYNPVVASLPVKVLAVNDLPSIDPVPDKTFLQGKKVLFNITATDVDGDALTFSDNSSLFLIGQSNGTISFVPGNAEVGVHHINVTVSDGVGPSASVLFNLTVQNANDAPNIITVPAKTATEDSLYNVTFVADDIDLVYADKLLWSVQVTPNGTSQSPSWLSMNATSGALKGTPTNAEVGKWDLSITVVDKFAARDTLDYQLEVLNTNDDPVFIDVPAKEIQVALGEEYTFDVKATDVDLADTLTYHISSVPVSWNLTQDPSTGILSFRPTDRSYDHYLISLSVTDNTVTVGYVFNISVTIPNTPPHFTSVPTTLAKTGVLWTYTPTAADADTDAVVISLVTGPAGMALKNGTLEWTPSSNQVGAQSVVLQATDGQDPVRQDFKVSVTRSNRGPVVMPIMSLSTKAGKTISFQVSATDPDGDAMTYMILDGPSKANISSTGLFTWKTSRSDVGTALIKVGVSDGKSTTAAYFNVTLTKASSGNGGLGSAILLPIILIIAMVGVVIGVLVALMRRNKGKGQTVAQAPVLQPTPPAVQQPPQQQAPAWSSGQDIVQAPADQYAPAPEYYAPPTSQYAQEYPGTVDNTQPQPEEGAQEQTTQDGQPPQ